MSKPRHKNPTVIEMEPISENNYTPRVKNKSPQRQKRNSYNSDFGNTLPSSVAKSVQGSFEGAKKAIKQSGQSQRITQKEQTKSQKQALQSLDCRERPSKRNARIERMNKDNNRSKEKINRDNNKSNEKMVDTLVKAGTAALAVTALACTVVKVVETLSSDE